MMRVHRPGLVALALAAGFLVACSNDSPTGTSNSPLAGISQRDGTDSTGKVVSTSFVAPPAPVNSTGAFVSGITPINRALETFLAGRLQTYAELTAVTKTDFGWKPVSP